MQVKSYKLFLIPQNPDQMDYPTKLKTSSWQKRRLQIFERDSFKCRICGKGDNETQIEVHHKDYFTDKEPWEYRDEDLVTLCNKHHRQENKREKYEDFLLSSLKRAGFFAHEILALSVYLDKYHGIRAQLRAMITNADRDCL